MRQARAGLQVMKRRGQRPGRTTSEATSTESRKCGFVPSAWGMRSCWACRVRHTSFEIPCHVSRVARHTRRPSRQLRCHAARQRCRGAWSFVWSRLGLPTPLPMRGSKCHGRKAGSRFCGLAPGGTVRIRALSVRKDRRRMSPDARVPDGRCRAMRAHGGARWVRPSLTKLHATSI
jgi:hypothetical protein